MMSMGHLQEIGIVAGAGATPAPSAAAPAPAAAKVAPSKGPSSSSAPSASASASSAPAAAAAAPGPPPAPVQELSKEALDKMSKEERKAYHMARLAAQRAGPAQAEEGGAGGAAGAPAAAQLTKAQRRAIQEAQRKAKEDKQMSTGDAEEMLKELKLQGLTEDQAREVMVELARAEAEGVDEEDDEEEEAEDLITSVRRWMLEQDKPDTESLHDDMLRDFNMKVRFQGHVDTTPPEHLKCILLALAETACSKLDLATSKLQPNAVCEKVTPDFKKWAPLLVPLYGKIDDALEAADVVVHSIIDGVAAASGDADVPEATQARAVVGCLMALLAIDVIEAEDLAPGCKRAKLESKVMDQFIEFLEQDDDEDDDGDD